MDERLPIFEVEDALRAGWRETRRTVLSAPTGSGKSTQVPQMLLKHGLLGEGQVVILQPRRLAARLLAARVAEEVGGRLGGTVGYQIRFENCTSRDTRIRYVTEGILLRQMLREPGLPGVNVVIFDEFHERHLYGDITLAQTLALQETLRPDLRVIVMSATLDAAALRTYLQPCGVVTAQGRQYPVDIVYSREPGYMDSRPIWEQAADAWAEHAEAVAPGDALVFMPGGFEIAQTIQAIRAHPTAKGWLILPLHGELSPRDQDAAVARYPQRKVVVATNVAETSLTIDGVRLVIDSGLARISRYDPYRGINTLLIEKISRAAADQRAGRAGRTAPGRCVRLWSEEEHAHRPALEVPEVKRLDLSEVVLLLKAAGVSDLRAFRWLEAPDERGLARAEALLMDLGALDRAGVITEMGRAMLAFPMHPRYSRMLLAAEPFGCVYQAALIAALTQGRDLLLRAVDRETRHLRDEHFGEKHASDFWLLMRAWTYAARHEFRLDACRKLGIHAVTARQVGPLLQHLLAIAREQGLATEPRDVPEVALQKCILTGFSDHVACRVDAGTGRCDLVHGRRGQLAKESVVQHSPLLVAAEVREVEGRDQTVNTMLTMATAILPDWLHELYPGDMERSVQVSYDPGIKRVTAEEQVRFRGLPLERRKVDPPPAEAARLLAQEVLAGRLVLTDWDHTLEQWMIRLNRLAGWCPELELPVLNDEARRLLVEQICLGAMSYKDIKEKPVKATVRSWLSAAQQALLDEHVPERLRLANGRTPKVAYEASGPPVIALRIQELYDVERVPPLALGRVPVLLHILAPNMRPIQITQDLAGFWREHYPRAKQELQRKYPKHPWR